MQTNTDKIPVKNRGFFVDRRSVKIKDDQ